MNPFEFYGPPFLLFYALLTIATLIILSRLRRQRELEAPGAPVRLHDPYAIACLRGGKGELLRVATVSLVDRGLLSAEGDRLTVTEVGGSTEVRKPIEQALLRFCVTPRNPADLFKETAFDGVMATYEQDLAQAGLLPNDEIRSTRRKLFGGVVLFLLLVSVTKIVIGLDRGRPIGFLVILTAIALVMAKRVAFPRQTSRGKQFLAELRNLFQSLKARARQIRPGGANADLALAMAVFGIDAVPEAGFAWVKKAFPKASSSDSSSSSSCGSSCGSSGCGGGGCGGGGCGGCGG